MEKNPAEPMLVAPGGQMSADAETEASMSSTLSSRNRITRSIAAIAVVVSVATGMTAEATYALTPNQTSMAGVITALNSDLNFFWWKTFQGTGLAYAPPSAYYWYNPPGGASGMNTPCGWISFGPQYCPVNRAIYLDLRFLDPLVRVGDYTGGFFLAHEWSHNVQKFNGWLQWAQGRSFYAGIELQADCYAGVYTRDLAERRRLAAGDLEEAIAMTLQFGDNLHPMVNGAHGTGAQRRMWFEKGYNSYSLQACNGVYAWLYGI